MRNIIKTALWCGFAWGLAWAVAPTAKADQSQNNPECLGNDCGSPKEEGGGCSCSCGCSVWVSYTDQGKTLSYSDDTDADGIPDYADNCWLVPNSDQLDSDNDGIGDACDNCAFIANQDQKDTNGNGIGDVCDPDLDGDGIADKVLTKDANSHVIGSTVIATSAGGDNCPFIPNPAQTVTCNGNNSANCGSYLAQDTSGNTIGDACNTDIDGDGIANVSDNCPFFANADQSVMPASNLVATLCTGIDTDGDGVPDFKDNCPTIANPDQNDINQNGIGDVCDPDMDGDGIADKALVKDANGNPTGSTPILVNEGSPTSGDNCPTVANHDQVDSTNSGIGDACNTSYCFVVDRTQPSQCLDPKGAFQVNAGVEATLSTGETLIPPLWANRKGAAMTYVWSVQQAPSGSSAVVNNAKGSVSVSTEWAYQYVAGQQPTFVPDKEGTYILQLNASLVYPDRTYPSVQASSAQLTLTVGNEASAPGKTASTGCTTATGLAPLLGLGLGLGMLSLRRRRKA